MNQKNKINKWHTQRLEIYDSPRWKKTRNYILAKQPFCSDCGKIEKIMNVDHIIEHKKDNTLFFSEKNLHTLCVYHHFLKTKKDKLIESKPSNGKNLEIDFQTENKIFCQYKNFFGEFRKLDYCYKTANDYVSNNKKKLDAKGIDLYELLIIIKEIENISNRFESYNGESSLIDFFKKEIF